MFEKIQALVNAEVAALVAKMFPKISAADQADINAIVPHLENIVWRDLGVELLTKLSASVPAAKTAIDAVTAAMGATAAA